MLRRGGQVGQGLVLSRAAGLEAIADTSPRDGIDDRTRSDGEQGPLLQGFDPEQAPQSQAPLRLAPSARKPTKKLADEAHVCNSLLRKYGNCETLAK